MFLIKRLWKIVDFSAVWINFIISISEPIINLNGGPELHIKHGSRINITCEIENYPKSINYVTWFKNGKVSVQISWMQFVSFISPLHLFCSLSLEVHVIK